MPSYNFKNRFADAVRSGRKRSTIRAPRKDGRHAKAGDTLYLFTMQRTKQCQRLLETRCERTSAIRITKNGRIAVRGHWLSFKEIEDLAKIEGFHYGIHLILFFRKTYGLPFSGLLIEW